MVPCSHCQRDFKTLKKLLSHKCEKSLKNFTMVCGCGESFSSYEESLNHSLICPHEKKEALLLNLQKYETNVKEIISELKAKLKIEQMKSKVYKTLLEKQGIDTTEYIDERKDGVHFYQGKIQLFIHGEDDEVKEVMFEKKDKKQVYRSVNNKIITDVVLIEENEKKVAKFETEIKKIIDEKSNVSVKEITDWINTTIKEIKDMRVFTTLLDKIATSRTKLLGKLNINEYMNVLKNNVILFESVLREKGFDTKKISQTVSKTLSSLDKRLIHYGDYFDSSLTADELNNFKMCLRVSTIYEKKFKIFDFNNFYEKFNNYSICLFPIRETLKRLLYNPHGFSSIIYISLPKSLKDDPFSFYLLEKIENEKRKWKLDCRLEDFSRTISVNLLNMCIALFRKIYFDVYHDNIYRPDFRKFPIFTQDTEQLLHNILCITREISFCNLLRELTVKNATYTPSKELDKFNLTSDDPHSRKLFSLSSDKPETTLLAIYRMFDNITQTQSNEFRLSIND